MNLLDNLYKPPPKWYRITKKIWSNGENLFIGIWLVTGHLSDSPTLLIFKLASSFVKDTIDSFIPSDTEYAIAGTTEALTNVTGMAPKLAVKSNTDPLSKLKPPDIGGK